MFELKFERRDLNGKAHIARAYAKLPKGYLELEVTHIGYYTLQKVVDGRAKTINWSGDFVAITSTRGEGSINWLNAKDLMESLRKWILNGNEVLKHNLQLVESTLPTEWWREEENRFTGLGISVPVKKPIPEFNDCK